MEHLFVIKRNGDKVPVSFNEISERITKLANELEYVNPDLVAQKVCGNLEDGMQTSKLDEFAAETCAMMSARYHPNYNLLAARIAISSHHKNTPSTLLECVNKTRQNISNEYFELVHKHDLIYQEMIDYSRDFMFDYFGFKTLERAYLIKTNEVVIERPQHMWMRVAIQLHQNNFQSVRETYDALSQGYFIQATPTLFNSGTNHPQLSSCFLIDMHDSIYGIYKTLADCAQISKWAGGIGMNIHDIRARDSHIDGTNGKSTGIVPMLRVYNDTAKYVNQGGKRNGSFAVYLEPWHADIEDFLKLRLNTGAEEDRARDLFYALWIPDLFMQRVEADKDWSLFCPNEAPGLSGVYGAEFEEMYTTYEKENKSRKVLPARQIWSLIIDSQIQTGNPYLCYKDAVNTKSNQKNLGVIKSSNLCAEICEFSSATETAVCNLGSIALPKFVNADKTGMDYDKLRKYTKILARNLDIVIDKNFYPTTECWNSNVRNRPIGVGVQGLADVFALLKLPWDSSEAQKINIEIFEHIYFAALETSAELSQQEWRNINVYANAYPSFAGSPVSEGKLQCDLWKVKPITNLDWDGLRVKCKNGIRNSLSIALMPTASTSQILGNNECFEPFTSNLYTRRVLAGDFVVINKYLVTDLININLWTADIRTQIMANSGSIQNIAAIPSEIKNLYKTAWEISQKVLIDMSRGRAPFVCQSQSLNLFMADATTSKVSSMHIYAWKQGLKTGCYYLRTKGAVSAQKFTVEPPNCLTCSA